MMNDKRYIGLIGFVVLVMGFYIAFTYSMPVLYVPWIILGTLILLCGCGYEEDKRWKEMPGNYKMRVDDDDTVEYSRGSSN